MAAPIIPALKKVAVALLSDKRIWKIIGGVIAAVLFIALLPMLILGGMLSGMRHIDSNQMQAIVAEYEQENEETLSDIEETMTSAGFESRIEEAKGLYLLVLYDYRDEEDFTARLVGCFAEEQTDEQLITAVNGEFRTTLDHAEFTMLMEGMREEQQKEENIG